MHLNLKQINKQLDPYGKDNNSLSFKNIILVGRISIDEKNKTPLVHLNLFLQLF